MNRVGTGLGRVGTDRCCCLACVGVVVAVVSCDCAGGREMVGGWTLHARGSRLSRLAAVMDDRCCAGRSLLDAVGCSWLPTA